MERESRMELLEKLESLHSSRLLVYITGDRRGLESKIGTDVFPMFHKHLMRIGQQECIDLFIYSTKGLTIAGYALVNLIREFCEIFNVIIPFKALSTATLMSLGANEIVMTQMGQLSPIDPSLEHALGPRIEVPGQPSRIAPVSVEDVTAFIDFGKKELGVKEEDSMRMILQLLAGSIHPLTLGAVQRSREQIAFLAKNLMKYHCKDEDKIEKVVKILTRERFSHNYIIGRKEAEEVLGMNIVEPNREHTELIVDLFNAYSEILRMDTPYNPETELAGAESGIFTFNVGIIESIDLTHVFRIKKEIKRTQVQKKGAPIPAVGYQETILEEGWAENNAI